MIRSVTVQIVHSGQPRAYADSIHEAYLTFSVPEGQLWASKFGHGQADVVKPYVKLMVQDFYEGNEPDTWHLPRLKKLEQVSPGKWHVIIISPYLD